MDEAEIHLGSLCIPLTMCLTLSDILGSRFVGPAQLGLIPKCGFMSWQLSPDYPQEQGWGRAVTSASVKVSVFLLLRSCRWFLGHLAVQKSQGKEDNVIPPWYPVLLGWIKKDLFNGQHKSWDLPQFHKLQYFPQLPTKEHLHYFTCFLPAKGWISSIKLDQSICSLRILQFKGLSLHMEFHYSRKMHHKNNFYLIQHKPNKL